MNADVIVDNKFEPREANSIIRQTRDGEGVIGVADVHHYLRVRAFLIRDLLLFDLKIDLAVINIAAFALGTTDRDRSAVFYLFSRIFSLFSDFYT